MVRIDNRRIPPEIQQLITVRFQTRRRLQRHYIQEDYQEMRRLNRGTT